MMKSIKDISNLYFHKRERAPNSERSHLIKEIAEIIFFEDEFKKSFQIILGITRQMSVDEIRDIYNVSKNWDKNPKALFLKLTKEKNLEINRHLKEIEKEMGINQ